MNREELAKDLQDYTGKAMPTISDVAKYLGVGRDAARDLLEGLDYYPAGRAKKYSALDAADRIMQARGV